MSSTESLFSEDSTDYWQQVDRISEYYRKLTQMEERYIFECEFQLKGQEYKLVSGLSAARNYMPAVRILVNAHHISKTDHISFDIDEWMTFISNLKQYLKDFFEAGDDEDENTNICFEIDYIKLSSMMCMDCKILKVENGLHTYYMSEVLVRELINMHENLIHAHLFTLCKLEFVNYYNTFLQSANDLLHKSNYEFVPENVLLNLCSDNAMLDCQLHPFSVIQLYCIRECLYYMKDKVLNDLDRKMYFQST